MSLHKISRIPPAYAEARGEVAALDTRPFTVEFKARQTPEDLATSW